MHIEASREHVNVWTPLEPVAEGDLIRIGWVESGNFLCTARFLEVFQYSFPRIPTSRWDNRPTLSSGVGSTMSELLFKANFAMYRTKYSLLAHVGNRDSKMNPGLRRTEQLDTLYFADGEDRLQRLLSEPFTVHAAIASHWYAMPRETKGRTRKKS